MIRNIVICLWVIGFPVVWYTISWAVPYLLWGTGLLPEDNMGSPSLFGTSPTSAVCGVFPLLWPVVIWAAATGRLPGIRPLRAKPFEGFACRSCGRSLGRATPVQGKGLECRACSSFTPFPAWFTRCERCGYSLDDLPWDSRGCVTCPKCGQLRPAWSGLLGSRGRSS